MTITTERALLIVLTEAQELEDTIEMIENANQQMDYRATAAQRRAIEFLRRRERELRQVADKLKNVAAKETA